MVSPGLDAAQSQAIALAERISSGFSLAGLAFIILSFITLPAIRKPIHRLMFFAAWGDAVYNVATLIATSGIDAGQNSVLCQFQGFTIEMFLWTDTLWNLAMSIDVYLTVFHKWDNIRLKTLDKWYLIGIYGFSFLLAFTLCFAEDESRGKMYGPAILWCWISLPWDFMRMVMLYGPVWIMIIAIGAIYIVSGFEIFRKDREIRRFDSHSNSSTSQPEPKEDIKMNKVYVSTDTTVSTFAGDSIDPSPTSWNGGDSDLPPRRFKLSRPTSDYRPPQRPSSQDARYKQYSVTVETQPIPASSQRYKRAESRQGGRREVRARRELNSAAWGYTKCAILFFIALLITWLPSTINRVYALIYPDNSDWSLNLAAAIVLPLMGFWNTIIYMVTSWSTLRAVWRDRFGPFRPAHRLPPSPLALEAGSSQEDLTRSGRA